MRTASRADRAITRLAGDITAAIERDPGERGLERWAGEGQILPAARSLLNARRVVIATGFFIPRANVIETDGPPGALVLADALTALGIPVTLAVDLHAGALFTQLCAGRGVPIIPLLPGTPPSLKDLVPGDVSHLVAIERPGRSQSGTYHTMRGEDISRWVAPLDDLFLAPDRHYLTIGIGDGGNELGMGSVAAAVGAALPGGAQIACTTPADLAIFAGVSNWGGYGLTALLAALSRKPLLPPADAVMALLEQLVDCGAVDGIWREPSVSVDGLPGEYEAETVHHLQSLIAPFMEVP